MTQVAISQEETAIPTNVKRLLGNKMYSIYLNYFRYAPKHFREQTLKKPNPKQNPNRLQCAPSSFLLSVFTWGIPWAVILKDFVDGDTIDVSRTPEQRWRILTLVFSCKSSAWTFGLPVWHRAFKNNHMDVWPVKELLSKIFLLPDKLEKRYQPKYALSM